MHYPRAFVAAASAAYYGTHRQQAIHFSVMHQCTANNSYDEMSSSLTIEHLLQRSQILRRELYGDSSPSFIFDHEQLAYPKSSYEMKLDHDNQGILKRRNSKRSAVQRGFCNWLIPQRIMIGQYPGMTPESNGPTSKESQLHIQNMVQDANITLFCCLQTEVPSQDDHVEWEAVGGEVYLDPFSRREFPRPFTRYGPLAQSLSDSSSSSSQVVGFLHCPIEDLGTPSCNDTLLRLLSELLHHLESNTDNTALYLHCWGGRGRAGLIGASTASLLFPELSSQEILAWVQGGYDTRAGAESMHRALKRSPQTEQQRQFVREFVTLVNDAKRSIA